MKHHYVPVFYQKHFAAPHGLLWVYDRKLKTCKPLHPLSICFQHDLYALKLPSGINQVVETEFLRDVDGATSAALGKLPSALAAPGGELLGEIMYFVAPQFLRVPANKQTISMIYEAGARDLMETAFANVERATAVMKDYATKTGKELKVTPEAMVKAIKNRSVEFVATEMPFIKTLVEKTEFYARVFSELDVKILISPPAVGFVLSDNPVTVVPHPGLGMPGVQSPGTFVFVPLTRRLCLRLGQPGSGNGLRNIDRETVRLINENTAFNSDRFVMGPSKIQIESVIRRSGSIDINPKPRWITATVPEKDGMSRHLINQPRHLHYLEL
jgi:Protein of unknown function (DUF4238)